MLNYGYRLTKPTPLNLKNLLLKSVPFAYYPACKLANKRCGRNLASAFGRSRMANSSHSAGFDDPVVVWTWEANEITLPTAYQSFEHFESLLDLK